MCDEKILEILERLKKIEDRMDNMVPQTANFEYEIDGAGYLTPICTCGTSAVRCYKCFPWGTLVGDEEGNCESFFPPLSG